MSDPLSEQLWRHRLALHWDIPFDALRALLPAGVEPLPVDGRCWVTLQAMTVEEATIRAPLPLPSLPPFHQVEVRTLVSRKGEAGLWALSVDNSSEVVIAGARLAFRLELLSSDITLECEGGEEPTCHLAARRRTPDPVSARISWRAVPPERVAGRGTLQEALLGVPVVFARSEGALYRTRMEQEPLRVRKAEVLSLEETYLWAAGIPRPAAGPVADAIETSRVRIYPPERVE